MSSQAPNARTQSTMQRSGPDYSTGQQYPESRRNGGLGIPSGLAIAGLVVAGLAVAGAIYWGPDIVRYMKIKNM